MRTTITSSRYGRRNPVILNGKPVEENEALAAGDIIEVGPFQLQIDTADDALVIRVELRIGMKPSGDRRQRSGFEHGQPRAPTEGKAKKPRAAPIPATRRSTFSGTSEFATQGRWRGRRRCIRKAAGAVVKAQFNWVPTTRSDVALARCVFYVGGVDVGLISVAAAYWYTSAFAPAPIRKRTPDAVQYRPAIATTPNAGSCTNCHSLTGNMEQRCAACHNTEAFVATVIKPHEAAGIGCVDCHAEHQGRGV